MRTLRTCETFYRRPFKQEFICSGTRFRSLISSTTDALSVWWALEWDPTWLGSVERDPGDLRTTTDSWARPDCSVSGAGPAAAPDHLPGGVINTITTAATKQAFVLAQRAPQVIYTTRHILCMWLIPRYDTNTMLRCWVCVRLASLFTVDSSQLGVNVSTLLNLIISTKTHIHVT